MHLVGFNWKRLSWDQIDMWLTASCKELSPEMYTTSETDVSSANFHMENDSPGNFRSLIITKNSQGPKRVACATPARTFQ